MKKYPRNINRRGKKKKKRTEKENGKKVKRTIRK